MTIRRAAVIAYHSSPLDEPGAGDAGGMTVYVRAVARELAARGVAVDVFTRAGRSGAVVELYPGVRVVGIPAGPRRHVAKETAPAHLADFVAGVRGFRVANRLQYDVIHSHYWQSGLAAVHLAAGGTPFVHSSHTLALVKGQTTGPEVGFESRVRAEMQVVASADVLVASTPDEAAALTNLYSAVQEHVTCVPPGVDHNLFRPGNRAAARRVLGLGDEAVIVYAGRIQPLKGIDLAVEAIAELVHAVERDVSLVVVGGPSGHDGDAELERLRALSLALGLGTRVRFAGAQPHTKLPLYYRAADVVVVPSHSESFGLATLEAHACGTPVVSTNVGGAGRLIEHGRSGFISDERDPSAMAGYIKTILADDSAFRRRAWERAREYPWSATAESLHTLYECLVRERLPEACTC